MRKKSLGFIAIVIFFGAVVGTGLGKLLALLIPEGVVQDFFLKSVSASIGPGTLDILIMKFTFGFSFSINIMGIIGILIMAYFLRWIE